MSFMQCEKQRPEIPLANAQRMANVLKINNFNYKQLETFAWKYSMRPKRQSNCCKCHCVCVCKQCNALVWSWRQQTNDLKLLLQPHTNTMRLLKVSTKTYSFRKLERKLCHISHFFFFFNVHFVFWPQCISWAFSNAISTAISSNVKCKMCIRNLCDRIAY